jgi:hypothetical protein
MEDDYTMIKNAFKKYIVEEDYDVQKNPIIKAKIGNVEITFYFDVDEYADKASLQSITTCEVKK